MRNIFTYPLNASTNYVDPDYDGADNTEGLRRRISELKNGTHLGWNGGIPTHTVSELMEAFSKYVDFVDYYAPGNLKIYDFWREELVEHSVRNAGYRVSDISVDLDTTNNRGVINVEFTGDAYHDLQDGQRVDFAQMTQIGDKELQNLNAGGPYYAKVVNARNKIRLYSDAALTTVSEVDYVHTNQDDWHVISHNGGNRVFFDTSFEETWADSAPIRVAEPMNTVTGTINPAADSILYFDKLSKNVYEMHTNSALTSPATITNETNYTQNVTKNYNVNGQYSLYPIDISAVGGGLDSFLQNKFASGGAVGDYPTGINPYPEEEKTWGFCRIAATTTGSCVVAPLGSTKTFPSAIDDTEFFFWIYSPDDDLIWILQDWDADNHRPDINNQISFEVANAVPGTDEAQIEIQFVVMGNQKADDQGGSGVWYNNFSISSIANGRAGLEPIQTSQGDALYVIDRDTPPVIYNYGNHVHKQRTGASTYQFGIDITGNYWLPGATSEATLQENEVNANPNCAGLTGNAGYYWIGGSFDFANEANKGKFRDNSPRVYRMTTAADTYTPPALSTEAQQDVWDTGTQWDDKSVDQLKTFPSTVTPKTINWRVTSPTTKSVSQAGIKYTRSAGFNKYAFDVEYPPMTPEQFEPYNGFINAIRGQEHPFYFNIRQNNSRMIGAQDEVPHIRMKEASTAGSKILLVEGYEGFDTTAVREGELWILGDSYHGNIYAAVTSTSSNAYGEAKFRIATPLYQQLVAGYQVYNDPYHIVVSMDTDTIEVSRDTAGFYYLNFSATADGWK